MRVDARSLARRFRRIGLAATFAAISGCAPQLAPGTADRLLDGLFLPPTPAEMTAVERLWRGRDTGARGYRMESDVSSPDGPRTLVVSHTVDGARHYGAVRIPPAPAGARLPVLVVAHGGDKGATAYQFLREGPIAEEWIQVVPSFRSERLILGASRWYRSEGSPSPWDRDVDDAMSLLSAVLAHVPQADSSRVAVLGRSRGAGVALLMGVRDPRVDAVVDFFGPTDFFLPPVRALAERAVRSRIPRLPGAGYLADSVLFALRDGRTTLPRARSELLRRSAAWFAHRLPPTQIHHGTADDEVDVAHSDRLAEALRLVHGNAPFWEYHRYPNGRHSPGSLPNSEQRAARFLDSVVNHPSQRTRAR